MIINGYDSLCGLREKYRDKTIVFTSGTFDLTHVGHLLFFERCKSYGDALVVDVGCDSVIGRYKGENRPILNQDIRLKHVDGFKPVDYTVLQEDFTPNSKENIIVYPLFPVFERLKPDKWAVNPEPKHLEIRKRTAERYGIELVVITRDPHDFEGISTTQMIEKIKSVG